MGKITIALFAFLSAKAFASDCESTKNEWLDVYAKQNRLTAENRSMINDRYKSCLCSSWFAGDGQQIHRALRSSIAIQLMRSDGTEVNEVPIPSHYYTLWSQGSHGEPGKCSITFQTKVDLCDQIGAINGIIDVDYRQPVWCEAAKLDQANLDATEYGTPERAAGSLKVQEWVTNELNKLGK